MTGSQKSLLKPWDQGLLLLVSNLTNYGYTIFAYGRWYLIQKLSPEFWKKFPNLCGEGWALNIFDHFSSLSTATWKIKLTNMWGVPCTDSLSSIYKREVEMDLLAVPTKYRRKMTILVGKGTTSSEINFTCNLVRVHFWDHTEKKFKNKYSWIVLEQFTLIFSVPSLIYSYLPWCDASEYIYWECAIWWALCYTLIRNISDKHKNLKIIPSSVQRDWGPGQFDNLS